MLKILLEHFNPLKTLSTQSSWKCKVAVKIRVQNLRTGKEDNLMLDNTHFGICRLIDVSHLSEKALFLFKLIRCISVN